MMSYREWLGSLNTGDLVVIRRHSSRHVGRVERITATMVVLAGGGRFSRRHGNEVGAGIWGAASLEPATPDKMQAIKEEALRARLIRALNEQNWRALDTERLESVVKTAGITLTETEAGR